MRIPGFNTHCDIAQVGPGTDLRTSCEVTRSHKHRSPGCAPPTRVLKCSMQFARIVFLIKKFLKHAYPKSGIPGLMERNPGYFLMFCCGFCCNPSQPLAILLAFELCFAVFTCKFNFCIHAKHAPDQWLQSGNWISSVVAIFYQF